MDKDGDGFAYLRSQFSKLSDAKVKEGIFIGLKFGDFYMMITLRES